MTTLDLASNEAVRATPRPRRAGFVPSALAVARRTVLKFARTPQLIVVSTIQGAIFLLIFRYVFGGAISTGGLSYVDFVVPGFITTGVLFSGTGAAAGVAEDIEGGVFDRLRSLPIPRAAAPFGRALADAGLVTWGLLVTGAIGFAIGFRVHNGFAAAVAAFALCVAFGFAFEWMFMCIGLVSGNAQAAQGMSMLVFPLSFVSSAYVPVRSMPGWMQPVAQHQPVTVMVDAVRGLAEGHAAIASLGHSTGYFVGLSLLWAAAITVAFAPIAIAVQPRVGEGRPVVDASAVDVSPVVDGVATVTLNRPEKRNALSIAMRDLVSDALDRLAADEAVRCVVLTGAGAVFCAGFDLAEFRVDDAEFQRTLWASSDRFHRTVLCFPLPIVAAVNGPALAGGFDLAVMCDLRIAATTARFAHPEQEWSPVVYGPLEALVGGAVARDLCFTGRAIDANEALRLGVVSAVVEPDALVDRVAAIAGSITRAPRAALMSTKRKALARAGIDPASPTLDL